MSPKDRKQLYAIARKVKANSKAMHSAWKDFKALGDKDKTLFNQFSKIMFGKAQFAAGYAAGKNGTGKAKSFKKKSNTWTVKGKKYKVS